MRYFLFIFCILAPIPLLAQGAMPEKRNVFRGYAFLAPGAIVGSSPARSLLHIGGGGEFNLYQGLGVGAELGLFGRPASLGRGDLLLSINGLYSFKTWGNTNFAPFVTGGYSTLFRGSQSDAANFGFGTHYWFSRRAGIRLEFRDHLSTRYFSGHFIQGRIGFAFR